MIKPNQLVSGIRLSSWAFIAGIIILLLYLSGTTKPVLNFNNDLNTVMYPEQCFKPPTQLTQEYVDLCSIPQDYVKTDNIIIGVILLIGLIATLISDKGKLPEMADIIEAKDIVTKYLNRYKEVILDTGEIISIGKFQISNNFLLPEERIGKDRIPERYVLDVIITDSDSMEHYVRAYVQPYKRYIKGFVSADKPLEEEDRCGSCGKEFDVEYVDTEDLKKARKAIKGGSED